MHFVSFNVNSLRTRLHQIEAIVAKYKPDFIGLQETKVQDQDFPLEALNSMGYHTEYFGQKTHYGVALMSKQPFQKVVKGFDGDNEDSQKRFIGGEFTLSNGSKLFVYNGYFPQGESNDHPTKYPAKQKFYADLLEHLQQKHSPSEQIILMGDLNVAPLDQDIGIGEDAKKRWLKAGKCSFLPEERAWFEQLTSWGLQDTFQHRQSPETPDHSWFDYRTRGFEREPKRGLRIDFVLATAPLAQKTLDAGIDHQIRAMEKPSDHCPVWAQLDMTA